MDAVPLERFAPEFSIPDYSPVDALSFCLASQLAYSKLPDGTIDEATIRHQLIEGWGFASVEVFEIVRGRDIDTQGYVAFNDTHVVAAFRGTDSLPDWLTNLQAVKDPGPWENTAVHEGFQDAFLASALQIGEIIGRNVQADHQVWLTGHSLGGALAVLLAATLMESDLPVHGLYTFGAPRVGDRKFARALNNSLQGVTANWRVVNKDDLVPHVPLESFFSHSGNRMLLMGDGSVSHSGRAWGDFKESMWGWIGRQLGHRKLRIAAPHVLDSDIGYLQRLAAQRDAALDHQGASQPAQPGG